MKRKKRNFAQECRLKTSGKRYKFRSSAQIEKRLKLKLLKSSNNRCAYCGIDLTGIDCHLDHIIPRSKGGVDTEGNRAIVCGFCNRAKLDYSLEEFMIWLNHIKYSMI